MAEVLSLSTLLVCCTAILLLLRFFGKDGLYVYSVVAVIASNIQVLKLTQYSFSSYPIALGTVLFSTTFAVDNILNEHFGKDIAKKCIWISFSAYLFFVIVMTIAVLHPVVLHSECVNLHLEIKNLFSPTFTIFISSLISYLVSQHTDVFIFSSLKKVFRGKYVSRRAMISMTISTFIDNCVFSVLAWIVFADQPISMASLWSTYIFVTYIIRLVIAALCVPLVQLSGNFIKEQHNEKKCNV
jgi:uncharacterized integral membrane protein (TIGR00697 family)